MKAISIDAYGGPEVLHIAECERPVPGAGAALVRVEAIGVNPADTKWRAGMFASFAPQNFPYVPGYDAAGVVEGGDALPAGSRVAVMLDPMQAGAYAEYVTAPAGRLAQLPPGLDFATAAALPTPGLTGVQLIEEALDVRAGELVLITGAMGAVGRFALFAAKARGAKVVAAVRASHRAEARRLGADKVLVLGEEDWSGPAFGKIADTVGGAAVAVLCRQVMAGGKISTVATTPIPADGLKVAPAFYSVHEDVARLEALAADVAAGSLAVPIAKVMRLAEAEAAHRLMEAGGLGGKIILLP